MRRHTLFLTVLLCVAPAAVDSGALERRFDELLRQRMAAESIPGVVVAVV
jgi:hypothetical protein